MPLQDVHQVLLAEQIVSGLTPQDKGLIKRHFVGKRSLMELIERWITVGKDPRRAHLHAPDERALG